MKKYRVSIRIGGSFLQSVEAENEEEAIQAVWEGLHRHDGPLAELDHFDWYPSRRGSHAKEIKS